VASVVGLVCIHIFGYRDPAAEPLAERCGLAFQLTNIIRDVKEDAAMGRVYLPQEDLARFNLNAADLLSSPDAASFRPLLAFEADRALEFYKAGDLSRAARKDCPAPIRRIHRESGPHGDRKAAHSREGLLAAAHLVSRNDRIVDCGLEMRSCKVFSQ